ncbi:hypothetical protein SAMN05444487_10638 [Marininema mesophilum]|uniref:Uncharacterized protein n=1 Tax=Marininema mesophilum TaxID=1048340 RepID=A0A1H2W777_9BACL|nr:hypothetical protein [Marininema mesophilum]SDW76407.1 hypothetical protein SAMN05444487_10638 [Marininema mesophilum]
MANMDEYITTTDASKLFRLEKSYIARLAREAKERGEEFPVKRGRAWEAPLDKWEVILKPVNKKVRKTRKHIEITSNGHEEIREMQANWISCSKAAERYGISNSWACRLARRAVKQGSTWPRKYGSQWIAAYGEWIQIFEETSIRSCKYK